MSDASGKKKKKRSQAPVALVYFSTMLLFLAVFGMIAAYLVQKMVSQDVESSSETITLDPTYNTLYARVNSRGVLSDICVVRISVEKRQIIIMPASAYTVSSEDGASTFREMYDEGGMRRLNEVVEETFGINIDYYLTVDNSAFENVSDILGGIVYTPEEDLYYLSQENDGDDIVYPAKQAAAIAGRQIRLICQYPVFSEGKGGNVRFLGEALQQMTNNAFQQANLTKNNLDNIYNIMTANSDTNYTGNEFRNHKAYLRTMLSENLEPATLLIPEGTWTDDDHFTVSDEFKAELAKQYAATEPGAASADTENEGE